jgi:hypothetical protein
MMADAISLDPGNLGPPLRQPPQCRRAEGPQADHDHVLADGLHHRNPTCEDQARPEWACPDRPGNGTLPLMEIALVKAAGPGDRDRAYLEVDGVTRRGAVHVIHDLPHLAVESVFGITDGLWAELAAGSHAAASRAATARDPKRHKQGRIVSGAAARIPTGQWLTPGHRRAKAITNCVTNRWGDGPDTPHGVRDRVARAGDPALAGLLARVDDATIAMAIRGVKHLDQRWVVVPPGGMLRLSWPLPPDFFTEAVP